MQTVLIIGASGQVGQAMLQLALQDSDILKVVAPSRRPLPLMPSWKIPSLILIICQKMPFGGRLTLPYVHWVLRFDKQNPNLAFTRWIMIIFLLRLDWLIKQEHQRFA